MKLRFNLFIKEVVMFGLTLALGIFTAYRYVLIKESVSLPEVRFTAWDLVFFLVFLLFFIFAPRYKRFAHTAFRLFLVLVVFAGSQVVAGVILHPPYDLLAVMVILLVFLFIKNVLTHNIGVILGIAGVAAVLGSAISATTGLILLVALSVYDIIAVYITKHMVTMARGMIESGAPFGFVIPSEMSGFFNDRKTAQAGLGEHFMVLGSGDIGLPLVMAVSMVEYSLQSAVIVAGFSLLGLLFTHLIFVNQKIRKPMAALPPIATMTIIGYLVSLFI